jgi:hypothetical protein
VYYLIELIKFEVQMQINKIFDLNAQNQNTKFMMEMKLTKNLLKKIILLN